MNPKNALRFTLTIGLLLSFSSLRGQVPTPPIPGSWQLEFQDEFDGSSLDGNKWRLGQHWVGLSGAAGQAPENVTVSGGRLHIKSEQRTVSHAGSTRNYASGEVSTFFNFRQQHGYFEARIKYPAVTGLWPAFWLMPDRAAYGTRNNYYRTYLKFDLTGVSPGTINTAELRMRVSSVDSGGNNNVVFMKLPDDSWNESTLTWNNAPAPDPVWIAQRWNQAVAGQDMVVDVKDYVAAQMAGDKKIGFVLADTFMLTKAVRFHSREVSTQANRPRLVINGATYYATEDAHVRWGSLADTNYGGATELVVRDDWGDTATTFNGGMEIDIFESLGIWGPDVTAHAMHWDGYGSSHQSVGSGSFGFPGTSDDFHVYGMYWEEGRLEFYVDGIKTYEWANPRAMSVPAYLILSLQAGGWGGNNPGPQIHNQVMEVDWVRVWSGTPTAPSTLIVDNSDTASVIAVGSWTSATYTSGYHGADYQHDGNTGKGAKSFHYFPDLTGNGDYLVYGRWTQGSNRANNVPIEITDAGSFVWPVTVNQRVNGGKWNLLGGYTLSPTTAEVEIRTDATNGHVIADAVKFVPSADDALAVIVDNTDTAATSSTGTWTASTATGGYHGSNYLHDGNTGKGAKSFSFWPEIPATGGYLVYARWAAEPNRASNVPIEITRADGTVATVVVNQRNNGGHWVLLGGHTLSATNAQIRIVTTGTNGYVIADAVKVVPEEGLVAHVPPLMFDSGPTTVGTAYQTYSPGHAQGGISAALGGWNKIGTANVTTGLAYANGGAASGVTIRTGVETTSTSGIVNFAANPNNGTGLTGSAINTGIYAGTSPARDGIFHSDASLPWAVGVQVTGLSPGTYTVYLSGRNTNFGGAYSQNFYATVATAGDTFNFGVQTPVYVQNPGGTGWEVWTPGVTYASFTVTLTTGQVLNIATKGTGTGNNGRGFLNTLQIVRAP